jgi:hypothetical protein
VEAPPYRDMDVKDVLSSRSNISAIETILTITFEKEDSKYKGDGFLTISKNGDLTLRIYYLGFLRFEMTCQNNIVKSNPVIDRNKSIILTDGLRDCLFWWDITDFEMTEQSDTYLLENISRRVWLDRKTKFPLKQTIALTDGRELRISYEKPEQTQDIWYPSKIRIELSLYAVTLNIREISFSLGV